MSKLFFVFALLACVLGVAYAGHGKALPRNMYQPSRLTLTLDQALEEMIEDGTYERIMNAAVGAGDWAYPSNRRCTDKRGWKYPQLKNDKKENDDDDSLLNVLTRGALLAASRPNGIFAQPSASNSAVIGSGIEFQIVVELARRLTNHYGVLVEPVVRSVNSIDALWTGLANGDYDVVVAGISLTDDVAMQFEFSCEYFRDQVSFMRTARDAGLLLDGVNDCNDPSVYVGVMSGSAAEEFVWEHLPHASVMSYQNAMEFANAAIYGGVHVAIADVVEIQTVLDSGYCLACKHVPHDFGDASYRIFARQPVQSSAATLASSMLLVVATALLYVFF